MMLFVEKNEDRVGLRAAIHIAAQVTQKPASVLGLATGSTPVKTYENLIRMVRDGTLDFSAVTTFNLDEYVGLAASHPQSYRYFMRDKLFGAIGLPAERSNFPDGMASDLAAEGVRYEQAIEGAGGIDLQLLGIGENGHIGFCEPADAFPPATGAVQLTESTIRANARFFTGESEVPRQAISMGIGSIMRARRILLVATGPKKSKILKQALQGPITPRVPASVLQLHPSVVVVADAEAGALL